jgi:PAS domain S-box-containing protein
VTDVTDLKRTEAQLAERVAAIDAAQDGIALTDPEGRFRYMNPSHLSMFGFETLAEVKGLPWQALYEPDGVERMRREAFPALGQQGAWRGEAVGRRKDGTPLEQEVSLTLLPDGSLVCVTRDIAERRRNERERLRLREEVQTAHRREAVGQIAAGVAHDFNNLLSAITGSAALAGKAVGADSPAAPHLARITRAARSGADLMHRLLDLGARERRCVPVDLAAPLRTVADLVSAGVGLGVVVETDLPAEPLVVEADPGDILHLMLNLGINARDALGAHGGKVELGLRRATAADLARAPLLGRIDATRAYAVISVADNGSGVPADFAAEMFKPHVSTKGDSGTGLGLAIVAGVVAENDAALALTSTPGEGATFEVFWPMRHDARSAADAAAVIEGTPKRSALRGRTILIAEDSPTMLATIAAFLEAAGAEVAPCDDPVAAAEAIEEDPTAWDLLVTDLEMPVLDGGALARRARAAAPAMPVILCTGAAEGSVAAIREHFDIVLRKPITQDQLLDAACRVLANAQ